jgi:hypothetical protein
MLVLVLLLFTSFAVQLANAQSRPAPPSATELKSTKSQCPKASTFQPDQLEKSADILKAVQGAISLSTRWYEDIVRKVI